MKDRILGLEVQIQLLVVSGSFGLVVACSLTARTGNLHPALLVLSALAPRRARQFVL